uniref:Extended FMRFamide-3 n=1 Tax=Tyrannophasma gladiator TaxID=270861 RepID=FAR3_TYRGL|nr:RecName: Full=Extended FMRFamide-3; Short=FMRFa-3 [Tyrannophasma gladiator]
GPETAFFRL